jgi:hypothetical protein
VSTFSITGSAAGAALSQVLGAEDIEFGTEAAKEKMRQKRLEWYARKREADCNG